MNQKRKLLLLSSSRVHGCEFLEYASEAIQQLLEKSNVKTLTFIPYALQKYDDYTNAVRDAFKTLKLNFDVKGIHEGSDPLKEVQLAEALFIGGGNTFLLLDILYKYQLVDVIRDRVLKHGVPLIGSSAGTNVATVSIHTTNDMPIVYPPTFDALNLVPFNINPHYLDPDPRSKHKGETRAERIRQYQEIPGSHPVVGLREGSYLRVEGDKMVIEGRKPAIIFQPNETPQEYDVGSDLSFLLS